MRIVLVVEDDAALRGMYRTALRMAGYVVQEAANGLEALRVLDADPPDLVVLDLGLPVVSGLTVREELAAQAHTRRIPIVVVTGMAGPHDHHQVECLFRPMIS